MGKDMVNDKIKQLINQDKENNSDIENRYYKWISNVSEKNKRIFEKIFCDITYYSEKELRKLLVELYGRLNATEEFLNDAAFIPIESQSGKLNNSYALTCFLLEANNIMDNNSTIKELCDGVSPNKIVMCDDFVGSGKTIKDFLREHKDFFKSKEIYLLLIHCMDEGKKEIELFARENGLKITIHYYAISYKYFNEKDIEDKNDYLEECKLLGLKKNPLGDFDSEALVVTYRKTPNNTLKAVWKESSKNTPPFSRPISKRPTWKEMNKEKDIRRKERYQNGESNKHDTV